MSGERSDSNGGAGTSETVASPGCSLSERLRPKIRERKPPDLEGLAVFTWGRGEDGQLGLGDTSDQDEPTYVDALRGVGVRQIACGSGHTVVLTTDGEVYTWGKQSKRKKSRFWRARNKYSNSLTSLSFLFLFE
jgi:hypothetical protein